VSNETDKERGFKWWLRYVIVPIIGSGGVVAIIIALMTRPANSPTPPTPMVTPSLAIASNSVTSTLTVSSGAFQEVGGVVVMEAENFTGDVPGSGRAAAITWKPIRNADYTNGIALQASPIGKVNTGMNINGPALLYQINFETTGEYYVYVRGSGPDNSHDSIHVGLGGNPVTAKTESGTGLGFKDTLSWEHEFCETSQKDNQGIAQGCANELATIIDVPEAGTYIFFLWMREDGVIVDRIVLSNHLIENDVIANEMPESQRSN
jgi:hypothetical protein